MLKTGHGPPRVRLDCGPDLLVSIEEAVPLSPLQAWLVLLVYSVEPDGLDADRAYEMLWGEVPHHGSAGKLSQLLYSLNALCDGQQVVTRTGGELRAGLPSSGNLLDFRPDPPTAAAEFFMERRVAANKSTLRADLANRLDLAETNQDWEAAFEAAAELQWLDPNHEMWLVKRIENLLRAGRRSSAAAVLLAVGSESAYREEVVRDLNLRVAAFPDPLDVDRNNAPEPPKLFGRTNEMHRIMRWLAATSEDPVWLVQSLPGGGKSTFLAEVARRSAADGYRILHLRMRKADRLQPLGLAQRLLSRLEARSGILGHLPVTDLIRGHLQENDGTSDVRRLGSLTDEAREVLFLEAVGSLLVEKLAGEVDLIIIDDAELCDPLSLKCLSHVIGVGGPGQEIRVLASTPLSGSRTDIEDLFLGAKSSINRSHLRPLTQKEGRRLVSTRVDGRECRLSTEEILSIAKGLPSAIVDLVDWACDPATESDPAPSSIWLKAKRLLDAGDEVQRILLSALAVVDSATTQQLAQISGCRKKQVRPLLAGLVELGWLEVSGESLFLAHDVLRRAILDTAGTTMEGRAHILWGQLLSGLGIVQARRAVDHLLQGGAVAEAGRKARSSAKQARAAGLISEAADLFAVAVDCGEIFSGAEWRDIGDLQFSQCRYQAATKCFDFGLDALLTRPSDPEVYRCHVGRTLAVLGLKGPTRAEDAVSHLGVILEDALSGGAWEEAIRIQETRVRLLEKSDRFEGIPHLLVRAKLWDVPEDVQRSLPFAKLLVLNTIYGSPELGRDMTDRIIDEWRQVGSVKGQLLHRALIGMLWQGRLGTKTGRSLQEAALVAAEGARDLRLLFRTHLALAVWYCDLGYPEGAAPHLRAAETVLSVTKLHHDQIVLKANWGEVHLLLGRTSQAEDSFREGLSLAEGGATRHLTNVLNAGLGMCRLEHGAFGQAEDCLQRIRLPDRWWYEPTLIAQFNAAMLARAGSAGAAASYLKSVILQVRHRFVLPWLTLAVRYCQLAKRAGVEDAWQEVATDALNAAVGLGISKRSVELRYHLGN